MENAREKWLAAIGRPENYEYEPSLELLRTFDEGDFIAELYRQANGPGTFQRVMMCFPKNAAGPLPGVVVPFYFPEAMLGYDPATGEKLPKYEKIEMMVHLARRGYATVSADAYHLTYMSSERTRNDFRRWRDAGEALTHDHPTWTGIGKLIADTQRMIDVFAADPRVDASRLGIIGHSLGGKMAFYTGCLDDRIRVIAASDFGIRWDQTNWSDIWYWGERAAALDAAGMTHDSLLGAAAPKPMILLAGQYDDERSYEMMRSAPGYAGMEERLVCINHATGHRPPPDVLEQAYDFLDKWLK